MPTMTTDLDAVVHTKHYMVTPFTTAHVAPGPAKHLCMKSRCTSVITDGKDLTGLCLVTQCCTVCVQNGQGLHMWTKRLL